MPKLSDPASIDPATLTAPVFVPGVGWVCPAPSLPQEVPHETSVHSGDTQPARRARTTGRRGVVPASGDAAALGASSRDTRQVKSSA